MFKIKKERGREIYDIIDVETKEIVSKENSRKLAKKSMENLILLKNRKFGVKDSKPETKLKIQKTELEPKLKQNSNKKLIQIDKLKNVQFASDRPVANVVLSATEPKEIRKQKMLARKIKAAKDMQFVSERPESSAVVSATESKDIRKQKMLARKAKAAKDLQFVSDRAQAPVAIQSTETKEQKRQNMLARKERNRPLKILLPDEAERLDNIKKEEIKLKRAEYIKTYKLKQKQAKSEEEQKFLDKQKKEDASNIIGDLLLRSRQKRIDKRELEVKTARDKIGKFLIKSTKEKNIKKQQENEIKQRKLEILLKRAELALADEKKKTQIELKDIGNDAKDLSEKKAHTQSQLADIGQLAKKQIETKRLKVEKIKSDKKIKADEAILKKEQQKENRVTAKMQKQLALIESRKRNEIEKEAEKETKRQAKLGEIARKQKEKDEIVQAKLAEIERKNQNIAARSLQEIYFERKSAKAKKEAEKEAKRQVKLAEIERRDKETKAKYEQARLGEIERKRKEIIETKKQQLSEIGEIKRKNKASETITKLVRKKAELKEIQRVDKRPNKDEKQLFKKTPFIDRWHNNKTGEDASEAELLALGYTQKPNMDYELKPKLFEKRSKLTEIFEKMAIEPMYTNGRDNPKTQKQYEKLSAKKQKEFTLMPDLDNYRSNISGEILSQRQLIDRGYIEKSGNYTLSKLAQRLQASQEKDKPKVLSKPTDLVSHVVKQIEVPPESAPIVWNNPVIAPGPLVLPPAPPSPVQSDDYRQYVNNMDGTIIYIDSNTGIVYDNHSMKIGARNKHQKYLLNLDDGSTYDIKNDFHYIKTIKSYIGLSGI